MTKNNKKKEIHSKFKDYRNSIVHNVSIVCSDAFGGIKSLYSVGKEMKESIQSSRKQKK